MSPKEPPNLLVSRQMFGFKKHAKALISRSHATNQNPPQAHALAATNNPAQGPPCTQLTARNQPLSPRHAECINPACLQALCNRKTTSSRIRSPIRVPFQTL